MNQAYYQALLALAKQEGFEKAEVYASSGERFYVNVFEGQIEDYRVNASFGMGFRGLYQGKMGYAFSEIADDAAMKMLVTQAKENALAIENEDVQFIYDGSGEYESQVESFCPELEAVTPQQKIDAAFAIEKALLAQDSRVTKVMRASVTTASGKRTLCNTEGLYLEQKSNYFVALAYALAMDAGKPYTGGAFKADMRWETLDPQALAKQAVDDALSYVGAQQIPSGNSRVFETMSSARVSTFSSVFSAEAPKKGVALCGKEGTRSLLKGDALGRSHAKASWRARFDGEACDAQKKYIENGSWARCCII